MDHRQGTRETMVSWIEPTASASGSRKGTDVVDEGMPHL